MTAIIKICISYISLRMNQIWFGIEEHRCYVKMTIFNSNMKGIHSLLKIWWKWINLKNYCIALILCSYKIFRNRAFKYQRIIKREELVVIEKMASTLEIKMSSILKTLDNKQKWKLKNMKKCFLIWHFISYNKSLTLSTENKLPTFRRYFTTDCLPDPAAICSAVRPS